MSALPQVVYEDNHLLIAVKPPNMPAQADASGDPDLLGTMKAYVAERYRKPGAVYLGLVHRLDRPVGGLMALARTSKAAERLSAQVRARTLSRRYVAVVRGENVPPRGALCDWLFKDGRTNTVSVVPEGTPGAKQARLSYRAMAAAGDLTLLSVKLHTGRSHQIRVQLAHAGMPIWGDARYGGGRPGEQIALWGMRLTLVHPTRRETLSFCAPPPKDAAPWDRFDGAAWAAEEEAAREEAAKEENGKEEFST